MAFYQNRENQFKIGSNVLAAGMYNWSESGSSETEEVDYYDGTTDLVVKKQNRSFTFQCHSTSADAAAASIWALRNSVGDDCKLTLEWTDVNSNTEKWNVTVYNIQASGGGARDRMGFEFTLHFDSQITA